MWSCFGSVRAIVTSQCIAVHKASPHPYVVLSQCIAVAALCGMHCTVLLGWSWVWCNQEQLQCCMRGSNCVLMSLSIKPLAPKTSVQVAWHVGFNV
jgi:hypothetical protein